MMKSTGLKLVSNIIISGRIFEIVALNSQSGFKQDITHATRITKIFMSTYKYRFELSLAFFSKL